MWSYGQISQELSVSSSNQDGHVSRNPSLPRTTKRRITTNLKSINNQKCQKIKLHGSLTTKELKKQSNKITRPVRQWTERTWSAVADYAGGADWTGNWDSELTVNYGCCHSRRNSQSHMRICWKVELELSRRAALFPLWPLPCRQCHSAAKRVDLSWWIPKALPLTPLKAYAP